MRLRPSVQKALNAIREDIRQMRESVASLSGVRSELHELIGSISDTAVSERQQAREREPAMICCPSHPDR
jgi:hypothetical protein